MDAPWIGALFTFLHEAVERLQLLKHRPFRATGAG